MEYNNEYKSMTMTIDDVPEWIHQSELYRNFEEGEGEFQVNSDFVVSSSKIENQVDFRNVIQACLFWSIDEIPRSVFEYVFVGNNYEDTKNMFPINEDLWEKLSILSGVEKLNSWFVFPMIQKFASRGYTDCIEFCLSLFHDEEEIDILLSPDIYFEVIQSELDVYRKIQTMTELKNMGFRILHTSNVPFDTEENHMGCFIWLHQNGSPIDTNTLSAIIENVSSEDYLLYTLNSGVKLCADIMTEVCEFNNLQAVKLLIQFKCPCNEKALTKSIKEDNIDIMRLLCDYGSPMTIRHMYKAGKHGKVRALKFLVQQGCPRDQTVMRVVENQDTPEHIECLQYLIDNPIEQQ
jgi:hypothetical protein